MGSAFAQALQLIATGDPLLLQIIGVTMRMSLTSSAVALILGAPWGVVLAFGSSKLNSALIVVNRTLMGLPPVVCGLLCYLMFCGVGPLRFLQLLYTVEGMIVAQVILVTPIVAGTLMRKIDYRVLFPYAALFVALSFVTMLFVHHGDAKAEAKKGLEAFEEMDD